MSFYRQSSANFAESWLKITDKTAWNFKLKKSCFSLSQHRCVHIYSLSQYIFMSYVSGHKWSTTHRVLKSDRSKMGVIYMQSWKQCLLPVITTMALWQLMHLSTWCTVTHCWYQWTKECFCVIDLIEKDIPLDKRPYGLCLPSFLILALFQSFFLACWDITCISCYTFSERLKIFKTKKITLKNLNEKKYR